MDTPHPRDVARDFVRRLSTRIVVRATYVPNSTPLPVDPLVDGVAGLTRTKGNCLRLHKRNVVALMRTFCESVYNITNRRVHRLVREAVYELIGCDKNQQPVVVDLHPIIGCGADNDDEDDEEEEEDDDVTSDNDERQQQQPALKRRRRSRRLSRAPDIFSPSAAATAPPLFKCNTPHPPPPPPPSAHHQYFSLLPPPPPSTPQRRIVAAAAAPPPPVVAFSASPARHVPSADVRRARQSLLPLLCATLDYCVRTSQRYDRQAALESALASATTSSSLQLSAPPAEVMGSAVAEAFAGYRRLNDAELAELRLVLAEGDVARTLRRRLDDMRNALDAATTHPIMRATAPPSLRMNHALVDAVAAHVGTAKLDATWWPYLVYSEAAGDARLSPW